MNNRTNSRSEQNQMKTDNVFLIGDKPARFTIDQWHLSTKARYKQAEDQHQLADRIIAECERIIDETSDLVHTNKYETDHQLDVKVKDIEFLKSQVELQKKEMDTEIEALIVYRMRILDAQMALNSNAEQICKQCLVLREKRLGIDLCVDDVELELLKEIDALQGVKALFVKLLEQVNEQIRRLRALNYTLIRDIEDKSNVLLVDKHNTTLKETSINLSLYHGNAPLDPANITQEEWMSNSVGNIKLAHKELVAGRPLRAYIDTILKQVIEDLWKQYDTVNGAFTRRIEEYKEAKAKLENQHFETVRQANEIELTLTKLNKALVEKERFMALAHTRLGNRCQRSGIELCRDEVETYLVEEVRLIKESVIKLQQMISEAEASRRYLLKTQLQLEEDINIKTNSLKIDEVDCTTLRRGMDYHAY